MAGLWKKLKCGLNRWVKWIKWVSEFIGAIWVIMLRKIFEMCVYDHNV